MVTKELVLMGSVVIIRYHAIASPSKQTFLRFLTLSWLGGGIGGGGGGSEWGSIHAAKITVNVWDLDWL